MVNETVITEDRQGRIIIRSHWVAGSINPVKMEIIPAEDTPRGYGIDAKSVHKLTFAKLSRPRLQGTPGDLELILDEISATARRIRGKSPYDIRFFALVAQAYCILLDSRNASPVVEIAESVRAGKTTVQSWIDKARAKGVLSDETGGQSGGRGHGYLTDMAKEILGV